MTLNNLTEDGLFCDGDWIEKKDQNPNGAVRLIQLADIGEGKFKDKSDRFITEEKAAELKCTFLEKGDILVARLPEPLGRACIFPMRGKYITAVDIAIVRIKNPHICVPYVMHMINSSMFRRQIKNYETGTTRKRISRKNLAKITFELPTFEEQERIVARIEELFSELDKAVETLKTTKEQLAVYRQAVLKEAFESGLKENPMMYSIERIMVTDRKGMSTGPFGTMIKKYEHQSFGVPMLGIENIDNGKFVDGNKIFVTEEKAKELKSFTLHAGDIIISRSGTVGEICVIPQRAEGSLLSTNLMRVSLDSSKIRSDYFVYLFQSKGIVLDQVKELCKGSTRVFLNQTILKQINFPVPCLDIQRHIVEQIESRLSVCDSIEQTVDTALQQAEAMRQSILKQAFEGRLV
jgi:type I restriction enzyme S subunit